jgi:hypothetical protein
MALRALYVLDEPTTGLHPSDVEKLVVQPRASRRTKEALPIHESLVDRLPADRESLGALVERARRALEQPALRGPRIEVAVTFARYCDEKRMTADTNSISPCATPRDIWREGNRGLQTCHALPTAMASFPR